MDNEQLVRNFITENIKVSGGSCGITIPRISIETGIKYENLRPILKILYDEKLFSLREGINGKMIFKK